MEKSGNTGNSMGRVDRLPHITYSQVLQRLDVPEGITALTGEERESHGFRAFLIKVAAPYCEAVGLTGANRIFIHEVFTTLLREKYVLPKVARTIPTIEKDRLVLTECV